MKLSKRLETVASFVTEGSNIADIGTDHGYIPIYLVEEGRCPHAIAMDVRKGPLERAKAHIAEAGLEERIEVRLSDGLKALKAEEADCIVIAGMGGELVMRIMEDGRHMWGTVRQWVLSPQSDLDKVRRFLEEEEFSIVQETMIKEDGKYYTVMSVSREAKPSQSGYTEAEYRYGKLLIDEKNQVLCEFLQKEQCQLKSILEELKKQSSEGVQNRMMEITRELAWNKEAQDEMR
jgi:tRNA (adenine22-N1)-methyltransferase